MYESLIISFETKFNFRKLAFENRQTQAKLVCGSKVPNWFGTNLIINIITSANYGG